MDLNNKNQHSFPIAFTDEPFVMYFFDLTVYHPAKLRGIEKSIISSEKLDEYILLI